MFKDIPLGGRVLQDAENAVKSARITFTGPQGTLATIPLSVMGISLDREAILSAAYRLGREKPWPLSYYERYIIKKEGAFTNVFFRVDHHTLSESIINLEETFNSKPENAFFRVSENSGEVKLIPERRGFVLKINDLEKQLLRLLGQRHTPLMIIVPFEELYPEITAAAFREMGIETLMSEFSTSFNPTQEDRVYNITLASSHFLNYLVRPGEVVSLNNIIGNTTRVKGYRDAPVIVGNQLVQGVGGGLCQVSSTLYNAALLAGLPILERHSHLLAVPYIPPGLDATIAYGSKDLKFRNHYDHFLLINACVEDNRLTFRIFGGKTAKKVEVTVNILASYPPPERYEFDPGLPPGKEEFTAGFTGYLVEVWKTVYRGSEVEEKILISCDSYPPYPSVIRKGPPGN